MLIHEQSKHLREMADNLDRMNNSVELEPGLSLPNAMAFLRNLMGCDACITIEMHLTQYGASDSIGVEWRVWDGKEFHKAPTLEGALEICRIQNTKLAAPLQYAADVLTPSVQMQF